MYGLWKICKFVEDPNDILQFQPMLLAIATFTYGSAKFFVPQGICNSGVQWERLILQKSKWTR